MKGVTIEVTRSAKELTQLNASVQQLHHERYPDRFKPYNKAAVEQWFTTLLDQPNTHAFVARKNRKAIGYVLCFVVEKEENPFQYEKKVLLIDQISVEHEYKKQGIGQQLMKAVYELADAHHLQHIQLDHWEANEVARNFFVNQGFERYKQCLEMLRKQ